MRLRFTFSSSRSTRDLNDTPALPRRFPISWVQLSRRSWQGVLDFLGHWGASAGLFGYPFCTSSPPKANLSLLLLFFTSGRLLFFPPPFQQAIHHFDCARSTRPHEHELSQNCYLSRPPRGWIPILIFFFFFFFSICLWKKS